MTPWSNFATRHIGIFGSLFALSMTAGCNLLINTDNFLDEPLDASATTDAPGPVADASADAAGPAADAGAIDASAIDAAPPVRVTVTFQDGVDGYQGTHDATIEEDEPATHEESHSRWFLDGNLAPDYALLRFDSIFGTDSALISPGATIVSATLTVYMNNQSADPAGEIFQLNQTWDESNVTAGNLLDGSPIEEGAEYDTYVADAPVSGVTFHDIDVTSSLAAWSLQPSQNFGWIFVPRSTDTAVIVNSEAQIARRPMLTVTFEM